MASWKKSPQDLVDRFETAVAALPRIERRKMFGYPSIFLNGHLAAGLFQDRLMMRLSEKDRREFLKLPGAAVFEPMKGRPMREYVEAPGSFAESAPELDRWLKRSVAFIQTLPPKAKKAPKKKSRG